MKRGVDASVRRIALRVSDRTDDPHRHEAQGRHTEIDQDPLENLVGVGCRCGEQLGRGLKQIIHGASGSGVGNQR